jgi:hypothetical protein
MLHMLVRHRVKEFDAWKAVFDAHAASQREAGLFVRRILRNADDPDELFLLFEVEDFDRARAFLTSPDVPGAQADSGVLDAPDVYFLEE